MGFQLNQDYSTIEPNQGGGGNLPVSDSKGWLVTITDSNGQENSQKTGTVLKLVIVGQEGAAAGMTTNHFINITNPSADAMRIGSGECSAIAHATGHVRVGNSTEWHGKPFRAVVVPDPSERYPNATKISAIKDVHGNTPKLGGQQAMQGGAQQAQQFQQQPAQAQQQPAQFQQQPAQQTAQFQQQPVQQPVQTQFQPSQQQQQPVQQQQPAQFQQQQPVQTQQPVQQGGFDPQTGQPLNPQQFQQQQPAQGGGPGWQS